MSMNTTECVQYWTDMKEKAARNLSTVSECTEPDDEHEVKECLEHVLRHGSCADVAEAVVEAAEWAVANLELEKHASVSTVVGVVK